MRQILKGITELVSSTFSWRSWLSPISIFILWCLKSDSESTYDSLAKKKLKTCISSTFCSFPPQFKSRAVWVKFGVYGFLLKCQFLELLNSWFISR